MKKKFFNPLISIIMNCRNGEKYIKKSLDSILNQSYKNWELVFFDNESSDDSIKIAKKFNDKRIKFYSSKKKISLYAARNEAILKAKGSFIAFLDTDDWWKKNKLSEQVLFLSKNKKAKIIYSQFYIFYNKQNYKKINANRLESGNITKDLLKKYKIGILTSLIKKEVFKKFKFNNKFNIIGDFDLFVRLSLKYPIEKIEKPLAYYRLHESNYSKIRINEYINELSYWVKLNKRVFRNKNISTINVKILIIKLKIKNLLRYFF